MRSSALGLSLALATISISGCGVVEPSNGSFVRAAAEALFSALGAAPEGSETDPPSSSPTPAHAAPDAQAGRARSAAPPAAAEEPAPAPGQRVYYQYVDSSGTVRFVEDLASVPPDQRSRAGRIELPAPNASPRRATQPARRAFQYTPPPAPKVVVYTAPWCSWCRRTLAHLDERRVRYENRDIERNPAYRQELIEKTGRTAIPVVEINGERINGYDPHRIDRLLASSS